MARIGRPQLEWSTNTEIMADMIYQIPGDKLYGWCKAGISNAISDPNVGLPSALSRAFYSYFTANPITKRHPIHYGESFTGVSPRRKKFAGTKIGPYAEAWHFAGREQQAWGFLEKYTWQHIALNFLSPSHYRRMTVGNYMRDAFRSWNTTQKAKAGMADMIEAGIVKLYKQEVKDKPTQKIEAGSLVMA